MPLQPEEEPGRAGREVMRRLEPWKAPAAAGSLQKLWLTEEPTLEQVFWQEL